jgi:excisionase family DNA binding protein
LPTRRRLSPATGPDWLSLGDASRLLGVSSATIRRWSNDGRLATFVTPGGHRRFSRAALERLLPDARRRRPSLTGQGLTPTRLSRAYRTEDARAVTQGTAWLATLDAADREAFRLLGRRLAWALVAHLDAAESEAKHHQLAEATAAAAEYGRRGAGLGLSMSDVVEGFLAFRRPFLAEVSATARRRGFDGGEVADLFDDADRALDRLLVATMSGHTLAGGAGPARRGRRVRPVGEAGG